MIEQTVACTFKGKPYSGHFRIVGPEDDRSVSVFFEGNSIAAIIGLLPAEVVAETLLKELVQESLAAPLSSDRRAA